MTAETQVRDQNLLLLVKARKEGENVHTHNTTFSAYEYVLVHPKITSRFITV